MRNLLLFACVCLLSLYFNSVKAQQTPIINEVLASNDSTLADNTGEFEDWIELYNPTNSLLSLDGYNISNDINNPRKFTFSGNLQIPANGYLIIWASSDTTRGHNHIPFKVSASGISLYIYAPDGTTQIDAITIGVQKTDISFGRKTDGSPELSFFAKPTPGKTNNTSQGYLGILDAPQFSVNAGFYASPFTLNITTSDPEAQIIYTTDGSLPDTSNLSGKVYRYKNSYPKNTGDPIGPFLYDSFKTMTYVNPLSINNAALNPNRLSLKSTTYDLTFINAPSTVINKGTVVRAVVVKNGYISSEIKTNTYFISPGGVNKYTLPIFSFALSEDGLFDFDKGIHVAGTDFEKWRIANPSLVTNGGSGANWQRDAELPASFEFFVPGQTSRELQTNMGFALNGNWSRARHQKSFRMYFRSGYGASDFNYPILPDLKYKNYERLVLSNAGQDVSSTHMRDMIAQDVVKHLKFDTEHSTPVISFLNGEFWGIMNARERYDDNYFDRVYGIKKEELDLLDNNANIHDGTDVEIRSLRNFFSANDMTIPQNYQSIQTRMDIDNFIDYEIAEVFFGNNDWPSNNVSYFRKRTPYNPDAPYGQDGRFRWLLIDLDGSMAASTGTGPDYNSLTRATGTRSDVSLPAWSTDMLRKLLMNTDFKNRFITRYSDLLNTSFLPDNFNSKIAYFKGLITPHMEEHTQRWRSPSSMNNWNTAVNVLVNFANQRPGFARQHVREYFSLGGEKELTIDVSDSAQGFIRVNTIDVTSSFPGIAENTYPWKGSYYTEVPVTLVAKPKPGFQFARWEGDTTSTEDSIVVTLSSAKSFKAIFENTIDLSARPFHYWHFNSLPAGALTAVAADSTIPGNAVITYEGTGAGYMDPSGSTEGSSLNAQFNQPSGSSLRARNPSATRSLKIKAPTVNFKNVVLTYAATRTSKGAEYQRVFYTTDNNTWLLKADSVVIPQPETTFGLQTFDFSADANTSNNPDFAVRIDFFGTNSTGASGNDRFDNITFTGIPLSALPGGPSVKVTVDRNSVCTSSTVTFKATTYSISENASFQWKKNGLDVGTNTSVYTDAGFANKDTVYCIVTDGSALIASNKVIMNIVASPVVVANLTKTTASACVDNGSVIISGIGGVSPYQYSLNGTDYTSANTFTNLAAGTFTAYMKDTKGCIGTLTDQIAKASPVTVTSISKAPAAACANDGRINIKASGGVTPYTYSLNGTDYFTNSLFTDLAAGSFTAYVKDAGGCVITYPDVLTKYSALVITSLTKVNPTGCNTNDGRITINRTGGTSPHTYSLNGVDYFTSNIFTNLSGGSYTAYVKDARGCIATYNDVLTMPSSSLTITSLTKVAVSACGNGNDGSITINRTGGTSPFQYSLNGVNYFTSNVFSNLTEGSYTAYVKDSRGCIVTYSDVLTRTSSSLVITSLTKVELTPCGNGSDGGITINRTGGTSPYTYSLNGVNYFSSNVFNNLAAGNYTAYVKDATGCIATFNDALAPSGSSSLAITSLTKMPVSACGGGSDGSITINITGGTSPYQYSLNGVNYVTSNVFSNLSVGNYTAYVKDAAGCIATINDLLTGNTSDLAITSLTKTPVSACGGGSDGSITINRTGGASPYQYSLNGVNYFASNVFTNLAPGNYTAYVKDANGCIVTFTDALTTSGGSTLVITGLSKTPPAACADDGRISIKVSGGTSPYTYSLNGVNYYTSNLFINLPSGPITAYVKDSRGCIATFNDVLNRYTAPTITSLTKVAVAACKNNDGSITINRSGGTSPYTFSINGVDYFTSNVFSNLAPGTYTAYVKDARGCIGTFTDVLTKTATLTVSSVARTQPSQCTANGSIKINRSGGTSPFEYSLNNVNYFTSNLFSNLRAGTYTAYVRDGRGCTASLSNVVLNGPICKTAITSNQDQPFTDKLTVKAYPNPSTDEFKIVTESNDNSTVELFITDVAGRKLQQLRTAPGNSLTIGKALTPGMYFIKALQGKQQATLKVIKTKQ